VQPDDCLDELFLAFEVGGFPQTFNPCLRLFFLASNARCPLFPLAFLAGFICGLPSTVISHC
jgi:hypothetical protein